MMERGGTFQSYDSSGQLACLVFVNRCVLKLCNVTSVVGLWWVAADSSCQIK